MNDFVDYNWVWVGWSLTFLLENDLIIENIRITT